MSRSEEKQLKRKKTHELRLTKYELVHLRDLFGVVTPQDVTKTISQTLAEVENRIVIEAMLWKKVSAACTAAEIPLGDDAPDYVVAPTGPAPLGIFQISSDPNEQDDSNVFEDEAEKKEEEE